MNMKQHPVTSGIPDPKFEPNSRLEWSIGLGLSIACLLGILLNLFE
ncbi:MAG: hypothetical protein ACYDBV_14665 [Nitrospiria bacterium]